MKKIFLTSTLFFLSGSLFSQVHNEQVTVIGQFQPTVLDAHKINVTPKTIDSALTPRDARYDILSRKVMTSFGIDNIRPARVAGEPLTKLSPLYARAGYGMYNTPYAELFYGSGRSAQWEYGAHLKHRSSFGKFKNHEVPFDNSMNLVNLFGGYFGEKILLSADVYYDRKRHSAYGADTVFLLQRPDYVEDKDFKYIYSNIGGTIGFSDNNTKPNSFGYSGNLNINTFQVNKLGNSTNDFSIHFTGNMHRTFDFRHHIFNQTVVGLDVATNFHNWNILLDDKLFFAKMLKFHPYGKLRFSGHDFSLGLRINTFDECDWDAWRVKTEFQLVPTLHAKFNLIDNLLAIEFGMDGNVEYITNKKTVEINPFAWWNHWDALEHPQLHREYYIGLNTMLSKRIDFAMKGKLVSYKNLLNFDTYHIYGGLLAPSSSWWLPTMSTPYFTPTYQDVSCFQLQADLNYHLDEKITVSAMARHNYYDKESRDKILYKPTFEANLTARYNMQDKIILKTQLYVDAGRQYKYFDIMIDFDNIGYKKFKPTADWSIGAEYRFNKRWGAFLEFNNILNQRSYQWYNYRSYGLNFLLGITFNL
jgi:hypothetical protein